MTLAYIRGDYYLWSDGKRLHLWARDGYDGWDEIDGFDGERGVQDSRYFGPSGVAIPMNTVDAFVVMRFAEMLERGSLAAVLDNATSDPDSLNFGGQALLRQVDIIKQALCGQSEAAVTTPNEESGTSALESSARDM